MFLINISLEGDYAMNLDCSFNVSKGAIISALPLNNKRFFCFSSLGLLLILDTTIKTVSMYGKNIDAHSVVPFSGFDEDLLPLVLIQCDQYVVIFNIKLMNFVKVTDIYTKG